MDSEQGTDLTVCIFGKEETQQLQRQKQASRLQSALLSTGGKTDKTLQTLK